MISVAEAISDLLFIRDSVVVPGLGTFVRKPISAELDESLNTLKMPSCQLSFNADLREDNDMIIRYLIGEGASEDEARQMLSFFVGDCFKTMRSGQKAHLNDIGFLSLNLENELLFEPESMLNYNPEAFGLTDLKLTPLAPIVSELEPDEKEGTAVKVETQSDKANEAPQSDEQAGKDAEPHEEEAEVETHEIGKGVWAFLIGLVIIMSGMLYFKVIHPRLAKEDTEMVEIENVSADRQAAIENMVGDLVGQIVQEELNTVTVNVQSSDTIRIIAGCYDREESAQRMVNSLKNKGFVKAFMEKRGERWFVAYGRYHTEEEAHDALREIREVYGGKGWILK